MVKINWLASYPKAGSTWVRVLLEAYRRGSVDINNMTEVTGDNQFGYYQQASVMPISDLSLYQTIAVRIAALSNMALADRAASKERFIVKTHFINARLDDLPMIPDGLTGPSVYLIRDPRDVAVSWAAHQGVSVDRAIENMKDPHMAIGPGFQPAVENFMSSWDQHVASWETHPQTIVIRYEDLKADPETYFEAILEQYEYNDYTAEKCKHAIRLSKLEGLKAQELQNGFKESPKGMQFFGGKRPKLLKRQEREIINAFGETMERYGYVGASQKVA